MQRAISYVDVFGSDRYDGNPVAVVLDGVDLSGEEMQRFAHWTNLSETTFVLPATQAAADYRVRIFTPTVELPFAGHPTLGSAHAWLEARGEPEPRRVVQECAAGLVELRELGGRLAFAAPPLVRSGPVDEDLVARIAAMLGVAPDGIVDSQWVDNGPGWVAVLLDSADAVLALRPGVVHIDVGVVGFHAPGGPAAIEVRAFFPKDGATTEDPVTGSLQASLADWLLRTDRVTAPYVAAQGTALGRAGRAHVAQDEHGTIWVGGLTRTLIAGQVDL